MKIKNLFFIGFAAMSLFVACEEKEDEISGTPSIELSTNTLEFEQAADSETITLTANRDWVVEVPSSASSWLKVSPTSGSASDEPQTITIEVTENEGINRSAELEFNASLVSDKLKITQKGPGGEIDTDGINDVTVAEFIAAEVNDGDDAPLYRITGTLTYVRSSRYGNVYIEDNTGTVYAFGLCSDENLAYESYGDIEGLTIGDKVTVVGKRGEHESEGVELVDCYYESHEDAFINPTPKEVSLADFLAAEVSYSMDAYYQITGTITKIENATYGNIYIEDEAGTEVYIYGVAENNQLINASFGNIEGLNAGDIITVIGCRGEYDGSAQMVNGYYVSHVDGEEPEPEVPGEIMKVTVKEFLEKNVDDNVYYQLTGTIANLTNATYGNFDLVDETGTVYVYGLKASQDASNQSFGELGLKEGDIVTLVGTRAEFKGEAQVGGAYYISHEPGDEPTPGTPDIFFSEYVEGSSNNKYLEIYNPTDQTVDLSQYAIDLNTNGGENWSNDGTGYKNYTELGGTLAPGAVIVLKHSQAAIYNGEATVCNAVNFNGNDPVGLFKNGTLIDIIGTFKGGSSDFAKDVTLRRKASVKAPSTTYSKSEWEEFAKDDVSGLGSHTVE